MFAKGSRTVALAVLVIAAGLCATTCKKSDSGGTKAAGPRIALVSPSSGVLTGGNTVSIVTENFTDSFRFFIPEVRFDSVLSPLVIPVTPFDLTATVPQGTALVSVEVTVTSTDVVQTASCMGCYAYTAPPPCQIVGLTPDQGDTSGGNRVTIFGSAFGFIGGPSPSVFFGAEASPWVLLLSDTLLEAEVPPSAGGAVGFVTVTVQAQNGATCTCVDCFEYTVVPCTIASVSPSTGLVAGNEIVTILGSLFSPNATVDFGADPAGNVVVNPSGDRITCLTPAVTGVRIVDVIVTNPNNTCTLPNAFEFLDPGACSLASVDPPAGILGGGYNVTITGAMFEEPPDPAPQVLFGATMSPLVVQVDALTLTAEVPPTITPGLVTVTVTNQTSGGMCTLPAAFEYLDPGQPIIFEMDPPLGARAGEMVTIRGANLSPNPVPPDGIVFGSNSVDLTTDFNFIDANTVEVIAPSVSAEGVVDVTYTNPGPLSYTFVNGYEYKDPPTGCSVTNITPAVGQRIGGTPVLIDGLDFCEQLDCTDLREGVRVFFGDIMANPSLTCVIGTTQIQTVAPGQTDGGPVDIAIFGVGCQITCTVVDAFVYLGGCNLTGVSPSSGPQVGGTQVSITGSLFELSTWVRFGDSFSTNVTYVNPSLITAEAPPSAVTGPVDVTVYGFTGIQCTAVGGFVYVGGPGGGGCSVTGVSPSSGPVTGGNSVIVGGTGFDQSMPAGVLFGLQAATNVVVNNQFSISCRVPPGAAASQSVDVTVISENGDQCVGVGIYTYDPPPTCDTDCTIVDMNPPQGLLAGGNSAVINGTDFCSGPIQVWIGNKEATVGVITSTFIGITVPPGDTVGTAWVTVIQPAGYFCVHDGYTYQ
ncbi:MAG: IPT/TIG domain-containing protein [Planctomycetota bacterium]|nr:IPT/TIG domain-containing protein [Planctomycetota bacterium]